MAEDNTNSSLSSETSGKNDSDGGRSNESSTDKARRLSTGHGVLPSDSLSSRGSDDRISSRRYSTGKQISAKSDQSNLPHYLRASTGSCHDFCKYGRKHSFEQKPTLPLSQRVKKPHHRKLNSAGAIVVEGTKAKQSPSDQTSFPLSQRIKKPHHRKLNSEGAMVGEGKKVNVAEQTPSDPSRDPQVHFPAPPEIIKEVVFLQPKEVESSLRQDSSSDKMMPKTDTKMKNLSAKWSPRPQAKVSKQSSVNKSLEGVKPAARRVSGISSVGNSDIFSSSTSKSCVSKSPNMRKRMSYNSSTLVKNKNRMGETDTKTEEEKVFEKTLHVIEMEPKDDLVEAAQDGEIMEGKDDDLVEPAQDGEIIDSLSPPSELLPESSSNSNSRDSHIERNPSKTKTKAKPVASKLDTSPLKLKFRRGKVVDIRQENNGPRRLSFRKGRLLGKNQDNMGKDKLVVSMHDGHAISSPPSCEKGVGQDGKEGSGLANTKGDANKIALNSKGAKSVGRTLNKTFKKDNPVAKRVDNPLPVKLKFKRGTVVNPQHESNVPRRIGFVKVRHLRENQGSRSDVKKSFKKRVESGENSMSLNPGRVVLRHQDVQGKKDSQGLFNNVIEETASKLVETKKSKVKALVGAFETVISLQEKKPSAHAVS